MFMEIMTAKDAKDDMLYSWDCLEYADMLEWHSFLPLDLKWVKLTSYLCVNMASLLRAEFLIEFNSFLVDAIVCIMAESGTHN